jgi:hypothetical protein
MPSWAPASRPFFSLIRPGVHTDPLEYPLLALVLLLLPVGAIVALEPALRGDSNGRRSYPIANMLVAFLLVAAFTLLAVVLGQEILPLRHPRHPQLRLTCRPQSR